jgi:hypothetical protein
MATSTSAAFASTLTNGYTVRTTPTTSALVSTGDTLVSQNINTNTDSIENKKIVMGFDVKVAYLNVGMSLELQVSHNGTDWAVAVTIDADIEENGTGVKTYLVDLTSIYAPYARLICNRDGKNVGTSGTGQFFFAYI